MTLHARYGKLQTPAWPVFMCLAPSVNDSLSTSRYGEQLTLNQWVLGSSPRWCTKECLTRKCRAFFCCSILRRHDLVHRQGYSNRAAARSAVRNATVRRSFQCPDANILPGQIKNNMNIRICGRADTTLSTIIIGDGRAAEQIPHDAQGRFLMEDGTVFQAYYFNDDTISKW